MCGVATYSVLLITLLALPLLSQVCATNRPYAESSPNSETNELFMDQPQHNLERSPRTGSTEESYEKSANLPLQLKTQTNFVTSRTKRSASKLDETPKIGDQFMTCNCIKQRSPIQSICPPDIYTWRVMYDGKVTTVEGFLFMVVEDGTKSNQKRMNTIYVTTNHFPLIIYSTGRRMSINVTNSYKVVVCRDAIAPTVSSLIIEEVQNVVFHPSAIHTRSSDFQLQITRVKNPMLLPPGLYSNRKLAGAHEHLFTNFIIDISHVSKVVFAEGCLSADIITAKISNVDILTLRNDAMKTTGSYINSKLHTSEVLEINLMTNSTTLDFINITEADSLTMFEYSVSPNLKTLNVQNVNHVIIMPKAITDSSNCSIFFSFINNIDVRANAIFLSSTATLDIRHSLMITEGYHSIASISSDKKVINEPTVLIEETLLTPLKPLSIELSAIYLKIKDVAFNIQRNFFNEPLVYMEASRIDWSDSTVPSSVHVCTKYLPSLVENCTNFDNFCYIGYPHFYKISEDCIIANDELSWVWLTVVIVLSVLVVISIICIMLLIHLSTWKHSWNLRRRKQTNSDQELVIQYLSHAPQISSPIKSSSNPPSNSYISNEPTCQVIKVGKLDAKSRTSTMTSDHHYYTIDEVKTDSKSSPNTNNIIYLPEIKPIVKTRISVNPSFCSSSCITINNSQPSDCKQPDIETDAKTQCATIDEFGYSVPDPRLRRISKYADYLNASDDLTTEDPISCTAQPYPKVVVNPHYEEINCSTVTQETEYFYNEITFSETESEDEKVNPPA